MVFLATPKAGSTAVEVALDALAHVAVQRPSAIKHTDLHAYRSHIQPWLHAATGDTFTTVALMREPIDWLRSWYRFRLRDDIDDPDHAMSGVSFAEFAEDYVNPAGKSTQEIGSQAAFLTHETDQVDRIFRYEDIDAFTHFLEERLDCAISLPRVNVPPAVDVSLDAPHEIRLRQFMYRDLALYGRI